MAVRRRQLQFGQVISGIPETRPDDDGAGWVLLADDGQRFGQVFVPERRGQFARRLIEHLKEHALRRALAVGGKRTGYEDDKDEEKCPSGLCKLTQLRSSAG